MSVICVDPCTNPLWLRLAEQHPSSVFNSPNWLRVVVDTYGLEMQGYVLLDDAGNPVAGIPVCRVTDFISKRIASMPFSDYCDPLVRDYEQWRHLVDPLLAEERPFLIRCLHNNIPSMDDRFTLINKARWHGLNLESDIDTIWSNLHDSSRRSIKKAQRNGVTVRVAQHKEELRAFFELHLNVRKRKYRLLAQPYSFFENIWRHFIEEQMGLLMVAVHQDKIIAGVLYLEWNNELYYKFNASLQDDLAYRPNDLLIWEGIKYAKAKNYRRLDFGLSDWDQEGLVRYKRKFATDEKTISFLRYIPNEKIPSQERQARELLSQLVQLFTEDDVPNAVTNRAGEILYRFFI